MHPKRAGHLIYPIEDHAQIFLSVARQIENPVPPDELEAETASWLGLLSYGEENDPVVRYNRVALLHLLARSRDCFFMQNAEAPGAVFFGSMADPQSIVEGLDVPAAGASGRGLDFQKAFERCAGEMAEYLSLIEWQSDDRVAVYNPKLSPDSVARDWALAGIDVDPETPPPEIDWINAQSLTGAATWQFPYDLVVRRHNSCGKRQAESSGLAAGRTPQQAMLSGLLEAIERDAVGLWWWGGRTASEVDPRIAKGPVATDLICKIRRDVVRRTWFLDLTTDIGIPVVAALSSDTDGRSVLAGFGAHPEMATALERALLELCQMETAQQLSLMKLRQLGIGKLQEQDKVWIERRDRLHCADYPALTQTASLAASPAETRLTEPATDLGQVLGKLSAAGFDAWSVDLTRDRIGIPVAKVLVPGLQSANPDWVSKRLVRTAEQNGKPIGPPEDRLSPL